MCSAGAQVPKGVSQDNLSYWGGGWLLWTELLMGVCVRRCWVRACSRHAGSRCRLLSVITPHQDLSPSPGPGRIPTRSSPAHLGPPPPGPFFFFHVHHQDLDPRLWRLHRVEITFTLDVICGHDEGIPRRWVNRACCVVVEHEIPQYNVLTIPR